MVGWISIAGTTINYPVMQSRNNPNFYLKHNFEKEYSYLGTPYVQENCDIAESDNLVIYGHHIKGGKMFGALEDYKSKSFYEEHKNIQFDTLTEQEEYEIVAVFKTVAYSSEGFRYYDFVDAETVSYTHLDVYKRQIWNVIVDIHGAVQAIGLALLVLFFVVGVMRTCGNFARCV